MAFESGDSPDSARASPGVLAWRAVSQLQRPMAALIKSADRIGQGDYTRPLDVRAPR